MSGPWTLLREHHKDKSLARSAELSVAAWAVKGSAAWRCFRIVQIGYNAGQTHHLSCGGIELYGALSELQAAPTAASTQNSDGAQANLLSSSSGEEESSSGDSDSEEGSDDNDDDDEPTIFPAEAATVAALSQGTVSAAFGQLSCPVCLEELELGQRFMKMPCEHMFHHGCLDTWLNVNGTCPTCRVSATPPAAAAPASESMSTIMPFLPDSEHNDIPS